MRTVVLRVVALALLLLLALAGVLTLRTLQRLPDTIVYFVREGATAFTLEGVPRRLGDSDITARVRRQVEELAKGPEADEGRRGLASVVPADTVVRGAWLTEGVLTVDLSPAFERGGGSASMIGRLNQVYYTLSQPADVDAVVISVDGGVVDVFGGEGIMLEVPWSRDRHPSLPVW